MVETQNEEGLLTEEEKFELRKCILFFHSNLSHYDQKFEGDKHLENAYRKLGGESFHLKREILQSTRLADMNPIFPSDSHDNHLLEKIEEYGAGYKNVF